MPIYKDFQVLTSHSEGKTNIKERVVMTWITDEEESLLDEGKEIKIKRGNRDFVINEYNTYCYGIIDYKLGSNDSKVIATFNFLDFMIFAGRFVPSNYDYNTHSCISDQPFYKHYETWNPSVVAQYCHGVLGKPKRSILFRQLW